MTKAEFIEKHGAKATDLRSGEIVKYDPAMESDLDEVIKDELEKFAEHLWVKSDNTLKFNLVEIIDLIESYLKSKQ